MRLLLYLYNIILIIAAPFAFIIGFIIVKIKGGGEGFAERFGLLRLNSSPRMKSVWFHAASVGEVRSIKNITDKIRSLYPDTAVMVSTMTATGRQTAIDYLKADEAFLLPIENAAAIKYIIKLMGVKIFFVVDTEIWPNMINAAAKETNLIMINGRISERTFKSYLKFSFIFGYVLKKFSKIYTKSEEDSRRFKKIIKKETVVETAGNIKFQSRKNAEDISLIKDFENMRIFLAASTHPSEEEFILTNIKTERLSFDKILIAPRHINRSMEIKILAENLGYTTALYSDKNFIEKEVVIIDAFGMLESLYIMSDKIFIGGSIAKIGGHNIYEALQFYKNVMTGPNNENFVEIVKDAQIFGLVDIFSSAEEFMALLRKNISSPKKSFDDFFALIDEKNEKIIDLIVDQGAVYLSDKK